MKTKTVVIKGKFQTHSAGRESFYKSLFYGEEFL